MLVFAALLLLGFPLLLTLQKLVALPVFEDSHHQLYREPHKTRISKRPGLHLLGCYRGAWSRTPSRMPVSRLNS